MKYIWHKRFKGLGWMSLEGKQYIYGFCDWSIFIGWFEIRKYKN